MLSNQHTPEENQDTVTDSLTCPVTMAIFHTPAQLDCGNEHYIEKEMADDILSRNCKCPVCQGPITKATPSRMMKNLVDAYLKEHPDLVKERYTPAAKVDSNKTESKAKEISAQNKSNTSSASSTSSSSSFATSSSIDTISESFSSVSVTVDSSQTESKAKEISTQNKSNTSSASSTSSCINSSTSPLVETSGYSSSSLFASYSATLRARGFPENDVYEDKKGAKKLDPSLRKREDYTEMKLLLVGDACAGKYALLLRFTDDPFTTSFITTIGIDFKIKMLEIEGRKVKLNIWDTAGQERFKTITTAYYRGTKGIALVYDVSNEESFLNIRTWISHIKQHADEDISLILIGNNWEKTSKKVIDTARGQALAEEYKMKFFEVSTINNTNITEAFVSLTTTALEKIKSEKESTASESEPQKDSSRCTIC